MSQVEFTPEQLEYLRELLQPRCCHVTGMHDPEHFRKYPERFCELQARAAWKRATAALGLSYSTAIPDDDCGWCAGLVEGRAEAGDPPYARGERVIISLPEWKQHYGKKAERLPDSKHPGVVRTCHWGTRDGKNQWLIDVKYDSGNTVGSENIRMELAEREPAGTTVG